MAKTTKRRKMLPRPEFAGSWDALRRIWGGCTRCAMHTSRRKMVFGGGAVGQIMAVGQAPGRDEDLCGQPFQGLGGQYTHWALKVAGIPWDMVFFDNCMACMCAKPKKEYLDPCRARLEDTIKLVRPRLIVAMGAIASKWVSGTNKPMDSLAGNRDMYDGVPAFYVTHPAEIMRLSDAPDAYSKSRKKVQREFLMLGDYARELEILPPEDE